ncbi:MAG: YkgJ family cysteine cluster protein [Spirochaetes bacterium]|nr:YkgJ family cysteine cluster protein [Spirochaetota bacterium]
MSNYCLECSKQGMDCCRESHAKFLTLKDAQRIAAYLGEEINSFALYGELNEKDKEEYIYIHKHQSYYYDLTLEDERLLQLKEKADGSCFFQADDGQCRIYPARPLICRTYPFWLSDNGELIFDGCSSDCRIVCAITGNDDPEDVTKLEDPDGTCRSRALAYIGQSGDSMKEVLGQMMNEIEDYKMNIKSFVAVNAVPVP